METIVIGTDFSESSLAAEQVAFGLAHRRGARLAIAHVVVPGNADLVLGSPSTAAYDRSLAHRAEEVEIQLVSVAKQRVERIAAELTAKGVPSAGHLLHGRPSEALEAFADERSASMIVVGSHGRRAPSRWFLGSVAERTLAGANRPVLVVPAAEHGAAWSESRPLRICVAVDFTEASVRAVEEAKRFHDEGRQIVFLHAYWPPEVMAAHGLKSIDPEKGAEELERQLAAELRARLGITDGEIVVRPAWGRVADAVASYAASLGCDLLVVAPSGKAGFQEVLHGSFTRGSVRHPTIPVLCLPSESAPTP